MPRQRVGQAPRPQGGRRLCFGDPGLFPQARRQVADHEVPRPEDIDHIVAIPMAHDGAVPFEPRGRPQGGIIEKRASSSPSKTSSLASAFFACLELLPRRLLLGRVGFERLGRRARGTHAMAGASGPPRARPDHDAMGGVPLAAQLRSGPGRCDPDLPSV